MKKNKGHILIESIVAISVVVTGLLGVSGLLSRSLRINRDVSEKFVATYLAAEGIEIVKNIIDVDIVDGNVFNTTVRTGLYEVDHTSETLDSDQDRPLYYDVNLGAYSYDVAGSRTPFKRQIGIIEQEIDGDPATADAVVVTAIVKWMSRGELKQVNLEDHFFDWR